MLTNDSNPDSDPKQRNKARRILKELLSRQRLFGNDYKYEAVHLIDTGHSFVYRVRVADTYFFFEEYGSGSNLRHVFVKAEDINAPTPDDLAKTFLLSMLKGSGWRAVAQHRYGTQAGVIIRATEKLIERLGSDDESDDESDDGPSSRYCYAEDEGGAS